MRKFENVDIVAALGAVVELNTENYKGDFKYDIAQFKKAAKNPDGENNRFLWISRPSGTHCFLERNAYIKDTEAFNTSNYFATILGDRSSISASVIINDRIIAYAVEIKGVENGKIKGNLCELDYRDHIRNINKTALPKHTVTAIYEDGTKMTLPHPEHDAKWEQLYNNHGKIIFYRPDPEDKNALKEILTQARENREKDARPAMFKVRVQNPKRPPMKQRLAAGKKQLDAKHAAAPQRAAKKNKNTGLGD